MPDEDKTEMAVEMIGEAGSRQQDARSKDMDASYGITVDVTAVLGVATMKVSQLLKLGRGAVVQLDRMVDEDIEVFVNDIIVAKGEVTVIEDRLAVKLTKVIKSNLGRL